MASVTLGSAPASMSLLLVPGADFVCTLVSQDGTWPATAAIAIEVADATWEATVSGTDAVFNVDQAQVNAVIAQDPNRFKLWYTDGTTRLLWGSGLVSVHSG
jgi:predicted ThiF/HesA family dinucleotide-utilizing enzyme